MWVVSKNESNCLSENKMVSTLNWRHVSLLYVVQSNILWLTILLSYHYRCNVVFTNYRFPVYFLLYIATPKNLPNHYCEQFYEYSYHQKNNSCTLCVPMFLASFTNFSILIGRGTEGLETHTAVKRKNPTPLPVFRKSLKRKPARLL